tara:strand:+ start:2668 stop:3384 length:717 start_codon:yes stop_codon:yes gene_type:complete
MNGSGIKGDTSEWWTPEAGTDTGYSGALNPALASARAGAATRRGHEADIYQSMTDQARGLREQAAGALTTGRESARNTMGNLSTALIGANAGRNPLAAQQAGLAAGRERAALMSQAQAQAGGLGVQASMVDQARAEGLASERTEGEIGADEIQAGQGVLATMVPWALENTVLLGSPNQQGPWSELYNSIISSVLPTQTTEAGRRHWSDMAKYLYYRQQMGGPEALEASKSQGAFQGQA